MEVETKFFYSFYWGSEEMEVETKFFYSSCMKYLKTDIIID